VKFTAKPSRRHWPSHRTPFQTPPSSQYMILNFATEPWCQCSIFRKTASIFSVTEHLPKPVSVIEITVGADLVGEISPCSDRFREVGIESDFVVAHLRTSSRDRSAPDDLCVKGDARDRGSEHLNGQSGQRPKRDAGAGRWIVSCVGVIEAVTLVSRGDKICR
jgi:hypothetical protein